MSWELTSWAGEAVVGQEEAGFGLENGVHDDMRVCDLYLQQQQM